MPSHAGRYNSNRMDRMREVLDISHSILMVPIYGVEHANVNLMSILDGADEDIAMLHFARIGISRELTKNKDLPSYEREGVFCVKPFEEDVLYGMAALLTVMGYDVYIPKLKTKNKNVTVGFRTHPEIQHAVEFTLFVSRPEISNGHIVTIDSRHALSFCNTGDQPDFTF